MRTTSATPTTSPKPSCANLSPLNTFAPSPYGEFYGAATEGRADRLFVFVTREGRVLARHADGTVRDVTEDCALLPNAVARRHGACAENGGDNRVA